MPISTFFAQNTLLVAMLALIIWAGFIGYRFHRVRLEARDVLNVRKGQLPNAPSNPVEFERKYTKFYGPTLSLFIWSAAVLGFVLTPVIFWLISFSWEKVWLASGQPADLTPQFGPWLFGMAMGVVGSWVAIAAGAMRLYHGWKPQAHEDPLRNTKYKAKPQRLKSFIKQRD